MGKLRPIGSEKLEGMDKIKRMIEISTYKLNTPQSINEDKSLVYNKTLADGNDYHIVKEKNGYVIKKGLNESSSDYIEPMKNRKYYSSYSQAMKRLNLIVKEVNNLEGYTENLSLFNEADEVKYFLKTPKTEQTTPGSQTPQPAPAPSPAPAPAPVPSPAPVPTPEDDDEMDMDLDIDTEMDMDMEEPEQKEPQDQDEEVVTYKTIQKLVGKLGQKTREFLSNEENELDTKQVKYIINSILSALPLESLDEEDKEEIMGKFEGGETMDSEEMDDSDMMGDEEGMESGEEEMDTEIVPPAPEQPEQGESYHYKSFKDKTDEMKEMIENIFSESKVDKVLDRYFKPQNDTISKKVERLAESHRQETSTIRFLNENPNTKIVGKNKEGEILLVNNTKLISINKNGKLV
jgi:hypothetical protein